LNKFRDEIFEKARSHGHIDDEIFKQIEAKIAHVAGLLEGTRQELENNPLFKTPSTTLEKCYSLLETLKAETVPLSTKAVVKEEPKKEADATMDD
jgi:hypothetical protein